MNPEHDLRLSILSLSLYLSFSLLRVSWRTACRNHVLAHPQQQDWNSLAQHPFCVGCISVQKNLHSWVHAGYRVLLSFLVFWNTWSYVSQTAGCASPLRFVDEVTQATPVRWHLLWTSRPGASSKAPPWRRQQTILNKTDQDINCSFCS